MTIKDHQETHVRLSTNPSPLREEEIQEMLLYLGSMPDVSLRRLYAELALQNLAAIRKNISAVEAFDKSSAKLSTRLLVLTWIVAGLTLVLVIPVIQSWIKRP